MRVKYLVIPILSRYSCRMTIQQTVEIPASHRLVIDVPREVPAGQAILSFAPPSAGPGKNPRQGWAEAFATMRRNGEDALLVPDALENESFDREWDW